MENRFVLFLPHPRQAKQGPDLRRGFGPLWCVTLLFAKRTDQKRTYDACEEQKRAGSCSYLSPYCTVLATGQERYWREQDEHAKEGREKILGFFYVCV